MTKSTRTNLVLGATLALFACTRSNQPQAETETHFLKACDGACGEGLSCICGACTQPCASDQTCKKHGAAAACDAPPEACDSDVAKACDVECERAGDCAALGASYTCVAGRCRAPSVDRNDAGPDRGGSGGANGAGQGGDGGTRDAGSAAGSGGSSGSGATGGTSSGTAGTPTTIGGQGGSGATACDAIGDPCCAPSTGDGPNFCSSVLLMCGPGNVCEPNCECPLGAYVPVCGVDGQTHDGTCGDACVPVEIACRGECPCTCTADKAIGCDPAQPGTAKCCSGLQCCTGVPYDIQGQCHAQCLLESDRNLKTDIHPADSQALLDAVARLPIHSWRYRVSPEAMHVGPMAQDFAAEFGLGADDRVIHTVDAQGVALAAIQALTARMEGLAQRNEQLQQRITELETRMACPPPRAK